VSIEKRAITDPAAFQPPAGFDEYRLISPLGSGRMGVVYLAHDELLERHVAVKFIPTIDDDALARFLVEARAAARLQHPNITTLYRVGQLDDRPYLIYEYVRGTSLDKIPRPIEPAEVLRIAIDLTRGLAAAHRRGVLHRDIKPGNAILADTGEAKLLDFGVAKLVETAVAETRASREARELAEGDGPRLTAEDEDALADLTQGQLLGTPYFMSPEAWRRQSTESSDLFSLGLVMYELLAGKGPFRDVPLPELPRAVLDRDARPLRAAAPAVPEPLAAVVDRCIRRDPAERFASADHLLAALEALRPARAGAHVPEGNPYRGLRPFEPEHRAVFFGRQRALTQALDRLRVERFLLVTGDSGVGKSSICAAGILPIASEGGLEDGRTWSVARMIPGRQPVLALVAALAPVLGGTGGGEDALERAIRDDPASLGRLVRRRQRDHDGLLVYVDQLEELVTLADATEASATAEAITALSGLPGVRVLATARSDFLSRLEGLAGFAGRVSRALFLLAPLGRDEIREAVVGPAAVKQVRFESEATIDHLVDSTVAAQGAMPLLQFALAELWERRDVEAGVIPAAALDELGGVSGALSRHADALIAALLPAERVAARAVMLRLVTVDRTRARRLEDELVTSPQARAALDALVRGRLVVAGDSVDGATYEIAHEALVEGWGTLATWLSEAAETRALHHRIETAAGEWRKQHRRDLLWSSRLLAEASTIPGDQLTPREREFLEASRRGSARTRWLRRAAVIGVVVIAAGVWIGAQLKSRMARDAAIAADLTRADQEGAKVHAIDAELAAAEAAAFREYDAGMFDAGEAAWVKVLEIRDRSARGHRAVSQWIERALLRDGTRGDVRHRYAEQLYRRAVVAERFRTADFDELLARMFLYDSGGSMARRWSAPATVSIASDPPGAQVVARRYEDRAGHLVLDAGTSLGVTPLVGVSLPPGSLVLELRAADRHPVDYPVLLRRGEHVELTVPLPAPDAIPDGYVWIPPGRAIIGSNDQEAVRRFFNALPARELTTGEYLIARHETTFAEWIAYLDALPESEREERTPRTAIGGAQAGLVKLRRRGPGRWELLFQPGDRILRAEAGQLIHYPGRPKNSEQDWLRMPVMGISHVDAVAYAAWLDRTGRTPGARLCTEVEWERAARGADDRAFATGPVLAPTDANVDETYGKQAAAFGPDEVGRYPASRTPFGLDDMAGNVWEWVTSTLTKEHTAARGGSFLYALTTARIVNRELPGPTHRDINLGLRLCGNARVSAAMK
jgi:formylglycine-generating enzyme required for sulfatase activity